jgi:hypothetical protein
MGKPKALKTSTVMAVPTSTLTPRVGVKFVILSPVIKN